MPAVARAGDVSATPGTTPVTGSTGTWTKQGEVNETKKTTFTSDGSAVVVKATCTFSYSGNTTSTPSSPVTDSSTVTLNPQSRKLTVGGDSPLVDGESAEDSYGNKLSVASSAAWSTS